jgi:hypothetical protein
VSLVFFGATRGLAYKKVSMIRRGAHDMPVIGVAAGTLPRIAKPVCVRCRTYKQVRLVDDFVTCSARRKIASRHASRLVGAINFGAVTAEKDR